MLDHARILGYERGLLLTTPMIAAFFTAWGIFGHPDKKSLPEGLMSGLILLEIAGIA